MLKRRFYRHDHGNAHDASDSSSSPSSSDSELETEATEAVATEAWQQDDVAEAREYNGYCTSSSSGYESEDSSAKEVDADSSVQALADSLTKDDDMGTRNEGTDVINSRSSSSCKSDADNVDKLPSTLADEGTFPYDVECILKCKSVFRCRICPRIVCLTEETLIVHLKSKRHARSEKLDQSGRLKLILNSDGKIEGEGETHAERHARIIAATQNSAKSRKRSKGRQRQRNRLKKQQEEDDTKSHKARQTTKKPTKKKHRSKNGSI